MIAFRLGALLSVAMLLGCAPADGPKTADRSATADTTGTHQQERRRMVRTQIAARGVTDPQVLGALRAVPRHEFVPGAPPTQAYQDRPLPIGHEQTISQPYIVARMTALARVDSTGRVLEVGTGSGYQAAVLGAIADSVYTIEIIPELARSASKRLDRLGYGNVEVKTGDGYEGWAARAPYDAIVVTAAPEQIPPPLIRQLAEGGRMVIPVGPTGGPQQLMLVKKTENGQIEKRRISAVRFVPFLEDAQ
jgi:protein-L-isoaspartate(D-aspartate) O-methyltransferase